MKRNISFGLALIVLAIFVTLSALNVEFFEGISAITIALTFLIIWLFISSLLRLEFFEIFVAIGLAAVLYKGYFGYGEISGWLIMFVAVLLGVGFSMIFGRRKYRDYPRYKNSNFERKTNDFHEGVFREKDHSDKFRHFNEKSYEYVSDEEETVVYNTSFSETTKFIKSKNLKMGMFKVELGSLTIYLDQATLNSEGATLDLYCRLGQLRVFVPRDVHLVDELQSNLGELVLPVENQPDNGHNRLILKGEVTLGEIQIIRT